MQIKVGDTIGYRRYGRGQAVGVYVTAVEQVSPTTVYVYGLRARLSDGAISTTKISALIGAHDTYVIH